ncbi:hypothetical protein Rhe02_04780 [Rhizocola hellebori]|uniref:Red chlorophyll catabolite reductase n=1 Tax=Rhizocola hellebori TaxID=1392758 RepID=A0A8J3VDF4_9ACTN|nr:hypothetical protein [Rhizocola hellebori]GIH02411.1 hypothetical protein Rhe02_04780 [Rhizocola hellebori]
MSLPLALAERTLASILDSHELTLVRDEVLGNTFGDVGRLRTWRGSAVAKVVNISLVVPQFQLDSHMIFAFTPEDSAVPHFTLDSVYGGAYYAFHLDLIPRAELASHLSYMDEAFAPLTPVFEETTALEGLSKAAIGPRQYAVMSPWMLVHRATEEAFGTIGEAVAAYQAHWSALVHKGLQVDDTDLAARDALVRGNIFSRDVDPVWAQVSRLLGDETTDMLRAELISNG